MVDSTDLNFLKRLGTNIVRLRKELNISQAELAYRIGMEKSNLSVIENGRSNPQVITLVKLAAALDCSLPELLDFEFDYAHFLEAPSEYIARKHKKDDK
ncbi:helix-turn-helix domain-containing protein [Parvicella tangerina]|uniref:HTH cro/C1-type domain-containing protein n=1 Tax=Parvicella tangerina TaxID=2829795 RepID=A0A916JQZ5_9FLAO|nr:helix-turn-helix transcriptional regulator [Parvicella tangerina]CAG5087103.1 hypothetical protein CRYO30217_03389 [Parvicella tangerina]